MKLKRVLASILAVAMVLSTMGTAVFAEGNVESTNVSTPEALANALTSDEKYISITLENDIDVLMSSLGTQTPGSGEYKLGGENTESIVINLNNHKMTITTTYMSSIGAKNDDAIIIIKNGSMNSTGNSAATWNINDLIFANCNYQFENVTFDKEVALTNTGKNVEMKNVTINGTGDYYALWIQAEGQNVTIDGLVIDTPGRGIKIDEQYSNDSVAEVTLNVSNAKFTTAKKAAIVVKSVKGAEITTNTVDISGVAADSKNIVWVDEDSADHQGKVTVNGSAPYLEGAVAKIGDTYYATFAKAAAAAVDGDTIEILADGEYTMPSIGKDVTIKGSRNVVIGPIGAYATNASLTFDGITLKFTNDNYKGFQHSDVMTYNNVKIVGQPFLYGNVETFNNCEFVQESSDAYNVWTYSAKVVEFNNCTFNSAGKSVLVYHESTANSVKFVNTTFNATTPVDGKAAIEIDTSLMSGETNITIDDATTANGFATGSLSGNTLWNVKKENCKGDTVVVVDDEVVFAQAAGTTPETDKSVALVDGKLYTTFSDAVKAATEGDTIIILADVTEDVTINKSIVVDGAEKTYTGKMTLTNRADVTIKNVNFDGKGYNGYAVESKGAYYVTIEDCTAKDYGYGFVQVAKGSVRVTVKNITVSDCNYGLKVDYSQEVVIENVDLDCAVAGVLNSNYGEKTITIKDSDISILGTWTRNNTTKSNYVFEGDNSIDTFVVDEAVDTFQIVPDSMLTAPAEITLTTIDGYQVAYSCGSYRVAEKEKFVEEIAVTFEKALEKEGEMVYNINITAPGKIINRLNSVDLTFALEQIEGENDFTIIASNDEVAINPVDNSKVRYEFHYNGKTDVDTDTAETITIGQVKFTGYGKFSFAVATEDDKGNDIITNAAHATKLFDSVVDTFVPGGVLEDGTVVGEFDVSDDTIKDITIAVPTRKLTIDITFPNAVENNVKAYQDMTVTIVGGTVNETIALGTDGTAYNFTKELPYNAAYTVTVSGAGYRTARYTVTMTEDKTLRFWNNVRDEAQTIEVGKETGAVNVTYLAGDIVKDNKINIYDLSAVVSYFGTTNDTTAYSDYAKYDLDRNGVIDSKDVAYVLVSWGN